VSNILFRVPRVKLEKESPLLGELFSGNGKGKGETDSNPMPMAEVSPSDFAYLLEYLYPL